MLMARDLARCFDRSLLAYDAGVMLDPWQVDLLNSTSKRLLVLAGRQIGKTEGASGDAFGRLCMIPASSSSPHRHSISRASSSSASCSVTRRSMASPISWPSLH